MEEGPLHEFELISAWLRPFRSDHRTVLVPPGDDAAVLRPGLGRVLVATTDALVDGVHFRSVIWPPRAVGGKAVAVNLSDLAAMGSKPCHALVALGLPSEFSEKWLRQAARGMASACSAAGVSLVGGNVTRASDLSFTLTLLGEAREDRLLKRSGARPGDIIYVSGTIGDSALGLESMLRRRHRPRRLNKLEARHCTPTARVELGLQLAGKRAASAAIDISDGLVADLGHLLAASGVGAEVLLEKIPLSLSYRRATAGTSNPFGAALSGGEDYELLFTAKPSRQEAIAAASRKAGVPVNPIGRIVEGKEARFIGLDGRLSKIGVGGWRHR